MPITLQKPRSTLVPAYAAALRRGWAPTDVRIKETIAEQLARIETDPEAFTASLDDPEAKGADITLPDGSTVPRLPGFHRWLMDHEGAFCGTIQFRWQPGTLELPPHVLGHLGYMVVPWQQGHGYAAQAVRLLLPEIRAAGFASVDLVINADNTPSRKTALACGARLVGPFHKPEAHGGGEALLYRIDLA